MKLFQSVAATFNFLAMDRADLLYSVKKLMREMASPRTHDLTESNSIHDQKPLNDLQICMDCIGQ